MNKVPDNVTVFIPNAEEKERLNGICDEIIDLCLSKKLPPHEMAVVLKMIVEGFQEMQNCYIPIMPQKVHLLVNFKRTENGRIA